MATNHLLRNTSLGGHAWVFLNWALGFRALDCKLVLLEQLGKNANIEALPEQLFRLNQEFTTLGLDVEMVFVVRPEHVDRYAAIRPELEDRGLQQVVRPWQEAASKADVLLNFRYLLPEEVVRSFRRSALIDIDPGLLQCWIHEGQLAPVPHDIYFSIGETVGQPGALFPDCGIEWNFSPAVVHLDAWPALAAPERNAPYTTVTNWWGKYEVLNGETVGNYKRTHFMECLDLPSRVDVKIELAVHHEEGQPSEMDKLRSHGFRARAASEVSRTPLQYHRYITGSRGEFSCAKPSCMLLQNAWISDRTLCYLASGRPAIVQHTGPSKLLPEMEGLLRFHDVDGAERCIKAVEANYDHHAAAARALVEKHFAADKVLSRLLERAMALPARSHHDQQ
jgi:ribosomal protein L34